MEGAERIALKAESAPAQAEPAHSEHPREAPPVVVEPVRSENELKEIQRLKDKLLEAGALTIEPLEGDPFVLSRDHVSTGEGVTIYAPDGKVTRMSLEAHQAQMAKQREAVRLFSRRSPRQGKVLRSSPTRKSPISWLKRTFAAFWSKLWK